MVRTIRKKKYEYPISTLRLKRVFFRLGATILKQKSKKQHLIEEWLRKYTTYLKREDEFDPERLKRYKAGDLITVEFGYNVGAEYGGRHYAIVIEDSALKAKMITVIPLTSLPIKANVNRHDVDLGILPQIKKIDKTANQHAKSVALINQIRSISKQRIVAPTNKAHEVVYIEGSLLQEIYNKLITRYTTKGLKRQYPSQNK